MSGLEEMQKANLTATQSGTTSLNSISDTLASIGNATGINTGAVAESGALWWKTNADPGTQLVGMNTDEASVNAMVNGIDTYTTTVKTEIEKLNALESAGAGFGPEVGAKVQEFTVAMKEACKSIVSQLDRFKEDIKVVAAAYRAKGENIIGAVGTTASDIQTSASSAKYDFDNGSN